jgi:class 3 adenylate cyclase
MSTTSSVLARTRYDFFPLHEGDGAFLVFRENPFGPLWSALVITQALENTPNMQVRMGLHSDWLCIVPAGRGKFDAVGDAINIAKGVMDYADARHILLSKVVVDMLRRFNEMQECLHELGEYPLKHGHRIQIFNLHDIAFGNPAIPSRLQLKAA